MKFTFGFFFVLLAILWVPATGHAQIKAGIGGGVITDNNRALLQGRIEIGPRSFHIASSFNFVLEDGTDWAIDFDGHYKVAEISDDIYLDIFPGINLLNAGNNTEIGLNLGGTLRIQTHHNAIYIEPKYTVGTYDSFAVTGGFIF